LRENEKYFGEAPTILKDFKIILENKYLYTFNMEAFP